MNAGSSLSRKRIVTLAAAAITLAIASVGATRMLASHGKSMEMSSQAKVKPPRYVTAEVAEFVKAKISSSSQR